MRTVPKQDSTMRTFRDLGAILKGHFVLASWEHSDIYFNANALYVYPDEISRLCRLIAEHFRFERIEAVIGPATGGIVLSQWVTYHLTRISGNEVRSLYADKEDEGFVIKRGYEKLIVGKNVLVVDDAMTTGGSVEETIQAVREHGGVVLGLGVLCERGTISSKDLGDPPSFFSLIQLDAKSWPTDDCPLCKEGVPVNTKIGYGKKFLAGQAR